MTKHYTGEAGTNLIFDCGVALDTVAFKYIKYQKGDGKTQGTWDADLYSSYSQTANAIGTYFLVKTLVASDFDTPGEWRFQTYIGSVDGTWYGETVKFNVYGAFE